MTEKTHAVGSLVFATGAFLIMDKCNMLDTQIVKIAQYGIITPYALWGAQIPDFDQDNPNRIVTNPVNRLIMDLFKVLGAKHRGIISHVLPIFLSGIVCLLMQLSIITFGMHKLSLDVLHLMLLIQNTLSSNRLLLYWDERWKCYLFPNYSYKRLEGQLLGKLIIGDLPLDNCSIEFNSLGIFKNTKFSESDQIYKNYTYNFQSCKITSCPELENIRELSSII